MILTILLFLAILSLLVVVHEWGHFMAARKAGMKVEEFGLGFPPRLFGWKDKQGMTWSINLIPLGGFVKIFGESGDSRGQEGAFTSKGILPRAVVLVAGVVMNLVLAFVLFTGGYFFGIPMAIEGAQDSAAQISDRAIHVVEVVEDSAAAEAGLTPGDRLLTINGTPYDSGEAARAALVPAEGAESVQVVLARKGEVLTVDLDPTYNEEVSKDIVGVALIETGTVRYPWYLAPVRGAETTFFSTMAVVQAFGQLVGGIFTHSSVVEDLSGPVGIAVLTGQVADLGFAHLVQFAAMLSINLAVINILPFPALDGGRMLFLAIEAVRRKPVTARVEQAAHSVGFLLLMLMVLFVTYKDVLMYAFSS